VAGNPLGITCNVPAPAGSTVPGAKATLTLSSILALKAFGL
jgi:hypothetical protein